MVRIPVVSFSCSVVVYWDSGVVPTIKIGQVEPVFAWEVLRCVFVGRGVVPSIMFAG